MSIKLSNGKFYITYNNHRYLLKQIGVGGNSRVYEFNDGNNDYAVKVFECGIRSFFKERYKRFVREKNIIKNKLKDIEGIIPCLIDYCPKNINYNSKTYAYYLMPKCDKFIIDNDKKIIDKLKDILSLAKTLKLLHDKKIAHRDIKPQNILILNNKICFSDFGIAIDHDDPNRLTYLGEKVGPTIILPPELQEVISIKNEIEYYKSDVYLLSKVLWMYLNKNNYGFYGEYIRDNDKIYFNPSNKENIKCFEPLHLLFEKSTYNEIDKRIDIDDFIILLYDQIAIIENIIDEKKIKQYIYDEKTRYFIIQNPIDKLVYTDYSKIHSFLKLVIEDSNVNIKDLQYLNSYKCNNCIIKMEKDLFVLKENLNGKFIHIYFCVDELKYEKNKKEIILTIKNDEHLANTKNIFNNKNIFFNFDFYLSDNFIIEISNKR